MISNPRYGWCDFNLGDFHGTPSYLTDVPLDLLEAFIQFFEKGNAVCSFDEEGTEFLLVLERYTCGIFVIEMRDETKIHDYSNLKVRDLGMELCVDIEKDLNGWQYFTTWTDDEEEVKRFRELLRDKTAKLRNLTEEQEHRETDPAGKG